MIKPGQIVGVGIDGVEIGLPQLEVNIGVFGVLRQVRRVEGDSLSEITVSDVCISLGHKLGKGVVRRRRRCGGSCGSPKLGNKNSRDRAEYQECNDEISEQIAAYFAVTLAGGGTTLRSVFSITLC